MFLVLSLFSILLISILSQPRFDVSFLTMTCYKSNSIPIQYLRVYHNFPSGPLILFTDFTLEIQPLWPWTIPHRLNTRYQFRRTDEKCKDTLVFTTAGVPILRMTLEVNIYLFENLNKISTMFYIFEDGFIDGTYLIIGEYTNFGIYVRVGNVEQEFIQSIIEYLPDDFTELLIVKRDYNDICVVTNNNNREVVLRTTYNDGKPPGFVFRINGEYDADGYFPDPYTYTAFECIADESFSATPVVFVDDYSESAKLYFSVDNFLYENENPSIKRTFFGLTNGFRVNIHKSFDLLPNIPIMYFLYMQSTSEILPDGKIRYKYTVDGRLYTFVDLMAYPVVDNVFRRRYKHNLVHGKQLADT